ncbi:MAG: hypothetical protein QNL62_19995 [Gammaproteobacteria bacterium]|nr:hypothetical protein [Gammaproteobacteria bacterium]
MKKTAILMLLTFGLVVVNTAFAGGPKATHPCYDVADCKSQTTKKDFSKCIKEHKEEAGKNAACAAFRSDKGAYLKEAGMSSTDELFN